MRIHILSAFLLFLFIAAPALADDPSTIARRERDSLVELYEWLHQHPELSFYEEKTAEKLVGELRPLGFTVTPNVGGHGFVAVIKNGSGPTVMVRTDLDGLPVVEQTGRAYASDIRATDDKGNDVGVMHACAHDIHMSSFVGTARALAELKDQWSGTLVMIGQPAEERGAGARKMLADGLYERFPRPDYALALHVTPSLETGVVGYHTGYALANVDSVDITIRGVGGHGAYPHMTKDPVVIAAQTIMALQTIVSRELNPVETGVVTVGSIHGGTKHNVISNEVKLQLTVRSYTDEARELLLDAIRRITLGVARTAGVPADKEPTITVDDREFTPATYNSPELEERLLPTWTAVLGEGAIVTTPTQMGGEDFSEYGRVEPKIPIYILWLGTMDRERIEAAERGERPLPSLHSPLYWPVPGKSIETGVKVMTASVLELMKK